MSTNVTKGLTKRERKQRAKKHRKQARRRQARMGWMKTVGGVAIAAVALLALVFGLYRFTSLGTVLPPIDLEGHSEAIPESHILDRPMPLPIQKHMLEHADGEGPPGVIINYNCEKFTCEEGLVERLTEIAQRFPEIVYLAPYPTMDAKIAVTRLGKRQLLDSVDEAAITDFILGE